MIQIKLLKIGMVNYYKLYLGKTCNLHFKEIVAI